MLIKKIGLSYFLQFVPAPKTGNCKGINQYRATDFYRILCTMTCNLLARSFYGKLPAILRVTTNKGSRPCGVDNVRWNTPSRRWKAVEQLSMKGYKAEPLKRRFIRKPVHGSHAMGEFTTRSKSISFVMLTIL